MSSVEVVGPCAGRIIYSDYFFLFFPLIFRDLSGNRLTTLSWQLFQTLRLFEL